MPAEEDGYHGQGHRWTVCGSWPFSKYTLPISCGANLPRSISFLTGPRKGHLISVTRPAQSFSRGKKQVHSPTFDRNSSRTIAVTSFIRPLVSPFLLRHSLRNRTHPDSRILQPNPLHSTPPTYQLYRLPSLPSLSNSFSLWSSNSLHQKVMGDIPPGILSSTLNPEPPSPRLLPRPPTLLELVCVPLSAVGPDSTTEGVTRMGRFSTTGVPWMGRLGCIVARARRKGATLSGRSQCEGRPVGVTSRRGVG